jgi:putative toxin-antitoxin system antitoxin component (TIGR02293 family)
MLSGHMAANAHAYPLLSALGGRSALAAEPATTGEWVARIRSGLPAASALAFKKALGLTNEQLASVLGVSLRTVARLDAAKSQLDPVSGDRLVRSARLYAIAAEVLEDATAAAEWLKSPQRALGGAIPLELAQTDVGARAVEALLGRMEHGVYT